MTYCFKCAIYEHLAFDCNNPNKLVARKRIPFIVNEKPITVDPEKKINNYCLGTL